VPIERPRNRSATLSPEFVAIKERCLAHLMTDKHSSLDKAA
jgi:hypothetical protein